MTINAIVTDIEGTTTDIAFVKDTLFPYAAEHLPDFIRANAEAPRLQPWLKAARETMGQPQADLETVIDQLLTWIAADDKVTALKQLQGLVWEQGYRNGDFHGHLYEDAYQGLKRWYGEGKLLFVFSSGSVQAQRLLFGHTAWGDLTALFTGFFDTTTGPKREAASYRRIQGLIGLPAEEILFLSDTPAELAAAREAGMAVVQLVRPGTDADATFDQAQDFTGVKPENC